MLFTPSETKVVIVGGGVIGCSIAYHLTKIGWDDVVLLERKQLTSGTTWHAAGLVSQVRGTHALTQLARLNVPAYARLGEETGVPTGFFFKDERLTLGLNTVNELCELCGTTQVSEEVFALLRAFWSVSTQCEE